MAIIDPKYNELEALVANKVQVIAVADVTKQTVAEETNIFIRAFKNLISDIGTLDNALTVVADRVSSLELNPVFVPEIFSTNSSANLVPGNAATYKIAFVDDGVYPIEIWLSNSVDSWAQFSTNSGDNNAPRINGLALKASTVSANGWVIKVTSVTDAESDAVTGIIVVDGITVQTLASVALGVPIEFAPITGQTQDAHTCTLTIYDAAHPSGISASIAVDLVAASSSIALSGITSAQVTATGVPVVATQATITKLRVAYQLQGTDTNADAAVTAGRYFDIITSEGIAEFQAAGYTKTGLSLESGASFTPWVQVTISTGTGVTQTGGWLSGTGFVAHTIPTAPTVAIAADIESAVGTVTATSTFYDSATLASYHWYKRVTGESTWVSDGTGTTPHTYSGLTNGAPGYDFSVSTVDSQGAVSAKSNTATGTPTAHSAPTAPTLGTPTIANASSVVAVTGTSTYYDGAALSTYNWYKRVTGSGTWVSDGTGASPHTYSSLTNGAPGYDFSAETVDNQGGTSAKSATVSVTPTTITYPMTHANLDTVTLNGGDMKVLVGTGGSAVENPQGTFLINAANDQMAGLRTPAVVTGAFSHKVDIDVAVITDNAQNALYLGGIAPVDATGFDIADRVCSITYSKPLAGLYIAYKDASNVTHYCVNSTWGLTATCNSWVSPPTTARFIISCDGTNITMKVVSPTNEATVYAQSTSTIAKSSVKGNTDGFYIVDGSAYTGNTSAETNVKYVLVLVQ